MKLQVAHQRIALKWWRMGKMGKAASRRMTLPNGPLDFCDRTCVPAPTPAGIDIFADDLAKDDAVQLWRVLRLVLGFARGDFGSVWYSSAALRAWEVELLEGEGDKRLRYPCAVIVGELIDPDTAEVERIAHACWCIVEATLEEQRSIAAALSFAEAASLSWPSNARSALALGRLFRRNGHPREAETWLNRARRLASHYRDHECVALSTSSLGMLFWEQGNLKQAQKLLDRAQRVTRRHGLRTLEGEVLHNCLVVAVDSGKLDAAEDFARGAFERYVPNHPKLPALAYDTAYLWLSRGYTFGALRVFQALVPHFSESRARIQVLCATGKAAGLVGETLVFADCATQVAELTKRVQPDNSRAAALVDLGLGALALGETRLAESALTEAFVLAQERGLSETVVKADQALNQLRTGRVHRRHVPADPRLPQEEFATRFASALNEYVPVACE